MKTLEAADKGRAVAGSALPGEGLRVLIIDDEPLYADTVAEALERVGYECVIANSGKAGARKIESEDFDIILTDLKMPDLDGLAILRKARQDQPDAVVVVISGYGDVKTAVEAIQQGAANYLIKSGDVTELRTIVNSAAERLRQNRAFRQLRRQLDEKFGFEGVIGDSQRMHEVLNRMKAVAPTDISVLIQGETGTGKELVAKAIHNNSPRKNRPFIEINCTATTETLLDDLLFGHVPGAFTGADKLRKGVFEEANGGTLFLDEIGDMPTHLQAKLLKVLEDKRVFRIGSNEPIPINVRVLSATHKDLEAAVAAREFRQDLYFRLNVMKIRLPALRERREDIPLLVWHFVKEFSTAVGKPVDGVAEPVMRALRGYHWPGNVRELRNLIQGMVVLDTDGELGLDDLHAADSENRFEGANPQPSGPDSLIGRPLAQIERYYTEKTLELTQGNREEAARLLGIGERTLYRVIRDWALQDQIKEALEASGGNMGEAAKQLGMKEAQLQRKVKKLGLPVMGE
jgi:two-component system, NtrC family, response regulator HydG